MLVLLSLLSFDFVFFFKMLASFQEKVNNMEKRQRQNTYREELERQIQATKHSKDMEKRKNEVHPLGPKYDVPGLSHWHQSSTTVIRKFAYFAKIQKIHK